MKRKDRRRYLLRSARLLYDLLLRGRYDFTFDLMPVHLTGMSMGKRMNLLKSGFNLIFRRLAPYSWPIFMQIELTNYCNLKCPVCPTGIGKLKRRPMDIEVGLFESLMNEVGPHLTVLSLWAWGESMLHPKLEEILRIAQQHNMATLCSTNGQNLNSERVLNAFLRYPPTYLIVSLDGLKDKTNSIFRAGARLKPALAGVSRLAEIKREKNLALPVLHMRYMVMKHNEHEVPQLQRFAKEHMFDMLTIRSLGIIDSSEEPHRSLVPRLKKFCAYEYRDNKRVRRDDFICQLPFISPTVFVDGTVVACDQDYNGKLPLGVLSDGVAFADIWFGGQAKEVRKMVKRHPEKLSFCRNCPYKDRFTKTCSIEAFDLRD